MMVRAAHQIIDTHEIWGFSDLNHRLCSNHNRLFANVNTVHEIIRLEGRHLADILRGLHVSPI